MTRLTGSSAVLLVSDIERAVEFWRDRLGFRCEVDGNPPDFATAVRDDASVLLALCRDASAIVPNWKIVDKTWNVYIRVDDAESAPPASVVLISGLPPDVTFSAGRSVVRGTWEVPLAAVSGLKLKIHADIKGRSDLVILLTHNSDKYTVVLASARSSLVVDTAPSRSEGAAVNPAEAIENSPHWKRIDTLSTSRILIPNTA